jgi:transcriptional repressor of dcmA and dcmR
VTGTEELLDISQAALFLQVSETSLRRWTRSGRLPCLRVGLRRERRFRRADLLAFLEVEPVAGAGMRPRGGQATPEAGHYCGFYSSDHGRAVVASSFLLEGLTAGDLCYLVAEPDVRTSILSYLRHEHPSLAGEIGSGRLTLSEYHASAQAQYEYYEAEFTAALERGEKSLRVLGDLSGGRLSVGRPFAEVLDYEAGFDHRIASRFPVVKLCLYDARQVSGIDMFGALKCHPYTLRLPSEQLLA